MVKLQLNFLQGATWLSAELRCKVLQVFYIRNIVLPELPFWGPSVDRVFWHLTFEQYSYSSSWYRWITKGEVEPRPIQQHINQPWSCVWIIRTVEACTMKLGSWGPILKVDPILRYTMVIWPEAHIGDLERSHDTINCNWVWLHIDEERAASSRLAPVLSMTSSPTWQH